MTDEAIVTVTDESHPKRARRWQIGRVPGCFPTRAAWEEWNSAQCSHLGIACTPCVDCSPAYQRRMRECGRCERPETVFVLSAQGGGLEGWSADNRRYARFVSGSFFPEYVPLTAPLSDTPGWRKLLRDALAYAHADVKGMIRGWLGKTRI